MNALVPQRGRDELETELASLRAQLGDALQTIEAIQSGKVDALVIDSPEGQRVFSLAGVERPYRALIEQMQESAVTLSADGSIHYCNRAFAALLKRPLETLTGGMLADHVCTGDRTTFAAMLLHSRRSSTHGEISMQAADGSTIPVSVSLTPLADAGIESVCMVATNLTDRKKAEAVSSSAQFVHGLIEKAPLGVAVVDEHRLYVLANPVYRALASGRLVTGQGMDDSSAPALVRTVAPLVMQVLRSGEPLTVPECSVDDRIERWLKINLVPLLGADDRVGSVLILTEDITDQKRAEDAIQLSQKMLKDADRRKDEFLATLAHELRNPLAPIRTAAQILGSPALHPRQLQWAQSVIQRQVGHMALLLDDLLDVARITQGKLSLRLVPVTLTSVIEAAVEVSRPLLDAKKHRFTVALPDEPVVVNADPLRLAQVISNLLTNAAKYTDSGGHIQLVGRRDAGVLRISVKDDGIGIPPESLGRIFEMFSQVEEALGRSDGGLGIGLALVKGLVALHGGRIAVYSGGEGAGSEFTVSLPVAPQAAIPTASVATASTPGGSTHHRILLVDDNQDAADSLGMLLELNGHEVRVAYGGPAGLALAENFRPDVVLLDIGMPEMNGYEVARALRLQPWARSIRLVALTGWGQDDDRRRSKSAGFDHHLTKPIDPDAIDALLEAPGRREGLPFAPPLNH